MRIEVLKNKETSLVIDDIGKSIKEDGILQEGYEKAIHAFEQYIEQTKRIREQLNEAEKIDSQINDILYQSSHNIIAFSGRRGTGKTSAMISFSEFLKKRGEMSKQSRDLWQKHFADIHTLVLSPIDPTMLENDENILNVVLSRLVYKAEERWNRNIGFYRGMQDLEKSKNKLLRKASDCMNGIQAVKKKGDIKSLADLQRIGDSAVLKKNLFDFVDIVNMFCLCNENSKVESSYLVIPIDDTDCQIQRAHEVMEDIRRYLTIPNVLILMATDADMLRNVFAQHYADEFETGIKREFLDSVRMEHYAEKYLTKLIPGTHRVYLPIFENILKENSVTLELGYYVDESKEEDLISRSSREDRDQRRKNRENQKFDIDFNFQSKVLYYIFQRTGIVFFEHSAYINNIIPTTMRGLAHLLNFLYSMKEVDTIDFSCDYTANEFSKAISNRLNAIEKNLDLFEEYFMNEWIPAKVPGKMMDTLRGIEEQVPANLIQYAYDEVFEFYQKSNNNEDVTYYGLMDMLGGINGTIDGGYVGNKHKHRVDFYYTFAVRTLISIKNNKQAIKKKIKALKSAKVNQDGKSFFKMFFDGNDICDILSSFPGKKQEGSNKVVYEKYLMPVVEIYRDLLLDSITQQKELTQFEMYCMQELSWIVLCNWDVQDIVYKSVRNYLNQECKTKEGMWEAIRQSITERNCGMLTELVNHGDVSLIEWPDNYISILENDNTESKTISDTSHNTPNFKNMVDSLVNGIDLRLGNHGGIDVIGLITDMSHLSDVLTEEVFEQTKTLADKDNDFSEKEKTRKKQVISMLKGYISEGKTINDMISEEFEKAAQETDYDSEHGEILQLKPSTKELTENWLSRLLQWVNQLEDL